MRRKCRWRHYRGAGPAFFIVRGGNRRPGVTGAGSATGTRAGGIRLGWPRRGCPGEARSRGRWSWSCGGTGVRGGRWRYR